MTCERELLLAMQKVEGSNPFSRFVKACDLQAFSVSQVGKCVCIGVHPLWTGAGRTIESLPKALICRDFARPRTADLLQVRRRSKGRLPNVATRTPARILSVRPQLKRRPFRPRTFAAQLPVPHNQPQCRASTFHGVPPRGPRAVPTQPLEGCAGGAHRSRYGTPARPNGRR